MSKTIITKKELKVPVGALSEVADILIENSIANEIVGTNPEEDTIILEVSYTKEERDAIHQAEELINDYEEEDDEEKDDEN